MLNVLKIILVQLMIYNRLLKLINFLSFLYTIWDFTNDNSQVLEK